MSRTTSPRISLVAVLLPALLLIATVAPAAAQVSVDLGNVDVSITYNGQPVGALGAGCNFRTELIGASGSYGLNICDQGHYSNIPVGNYTLRLYHWGVYNAPLVTPVAVVVTVGGTATATFEVAGVMGIVTGTITINSEPATTGGVCVSVGGGENCVGYAAGGTFKALVLAGTGSARAWGNGCQCITLGTMPLTAVAGQTVDGGSLNVSLGHVHFDITYNGAPVSAVNAGCNFRTELASNTGSFGLNPCDQGTYANVPAGNYTLRLYHWGVYDQPLVTPIAVTVTEGATANATFEVGAVMGLTTGTVLVNGQPHTAGGVCATVAGGQNCVGTNAAGEFTVLTRAGAGTASVWGNGCQCIVLGTFPIVVAAGTTSSAGTITIGKGNAHVSIAYLGQPVSALNAGCNFRTELSSSSGSFGLNLCDQGDYTGVPAGNYTLRLYHWGVYDQPLVATVPITITPGGDVSASFEVGAVMGIVSGFITINGQPANEGGVCGSVLGGQNCVGYGAGGTFRMLLRSGPGTGTVWNNGCQCHVIATFAFTVVAGTTSDIGNPLDTTPPSTTITLNPPANGNGWHLGNVQVSLAATDNPGGGVRDVRYSLSGAQSSGLAVIAGAATSVTITSEGITTITYYSTDLAGNIESARSLTIRLDKTAPSMAPTLPVVVESTDATGAVVTFASPASTDNVDGDGVATCEPPSGSSFAIGDTVVSCTAADSAGNIGHSSFTITVLAPCPTGSHRAPGERACTDSTPPTVSYVGNAGAYSVDQFVSIQCVATDASGIASTTCADISGPAWSFAIGSNTFSATATDLAGNTSLPVSTTFTVGVSGASLQTLVASFSTNAGVTAGLNAKLAAAANAKTANARAGQLGAFENQVNAQTGKALTAAQAALLIQLSRLLLSA